VVDVLVKRPKDFGDDSSEESDIELEEEAEHEYAKEAQRR